MQVKEKKRKQNIGRPGMVDKRFWMRDKYVEAVEAYQLVIQGKQGKMIWSDALEKLIETHPATRKMFQQQ